MFNSTLPGGDEGKRAELGEDDAKESAASTVLRAAVEGRRRAEHAKDMDKRRNNSVFLPPDVAASVAAAAARDDGGAVSPLSHVRAAALDSRPKFEKRRSDGSSVFLPPSTDFEGNLNRSPPPKDYR